MIKNKNYILVLKYDWLTKVYDPILQLTMPERKYKTALINQMKIKPEDRVMWSGNPNSPMLKKQCILRHYLEPYT